MCPPVNMKVMSSLLRTSEARMIASVTSMLFLFMLHYIILYYIMV